MTTHIAVTQHLTSGHMRWMGRCTCGWATAPCNEDQADAAVAAHLAEVGATTEAQR